MAWIKNIVTKLFSIKSSGVAADPRLFKTPANDDIDGFIATIVDKHMNRAVRNARANAPVKTGRLRANIKKTPTVVRGSIVTGGIENIVIYARRQEYEHKTKSFYMLRGLQAAEPDLEREMREAKGLQDIILRLKTGVKFTNKLLENSDE